MSTLYPLKFTPILKDKIWGGNKLNKLLGKPTSSESTGESWELSDVEGNTSIVANGTLKGTSLQTLLQNYKADLVGQKVFDQFGEKFPLLINILMPKKIYLYNYIPMINWQKSATIVLEKQKCGT